MRNQSLFWPLFILLLALSGACGSPATPGPDTAATVNAAVAATQNAQMALQATIDAAVAATTAAQPAPTLPPANTPTLPPAPVPTPATVTTDYATLTEEELTALIEQTVAQAVTATEQYSTAATSAVADNAVTAEEAQTIEISVAGAEEAIALAEELLSVYETLPAYAGLAEEAVTALEEVNTTLLALSASVETINQTLVEINDTLAQGLTLAEETIASLQTAAQQASQQADEVSAHVASWQAIREQYPAPQTIVAPAVLPGKIAASPTEAIQSAFTFVETGQHIAADGQLSAEELTNLAQLGADAVAGLNAQNLPQFQAPAALVTEATQLANTGNIPQLQQKLIQLGTETALATPPNQTMGSLPETLELARNFITTGRQASADGLISTAELSTLAQLNANVASGLQAAGGPQMQNLSGAFSQITSQAVRGEIPQMQAGLGELDNAIGQLPGFTKPALPSPRK